MSLSVCFLSIVAVHCVLALGISSKLDFGEPASSHAALSLHQEPILRQNFRNPEIVSTVREISCDSNDCGVNKNSDSASATADVVVHVKTQVNVPNQQNQTRAESVPDIPIIVGTKDAQSHHHIDENPIFQPNFHLNYDTSGTGFNVIGRNPTQIGRGFTNYVPNNGIPFNSRNNPYVPELHWYPQQQQDNIYNHPNPVEFTKIYKNTWTSDFPNDWSGYTNKRHTHSHSEWEPCLCNNPQDVNFNGDLSKWNGILGINKRLHLN
ncbi:hypothetical protein RN001_016401 [Aquatica leii]|uniref:Secreted protein n=1 Tax=Aquatica leii TaxID=1421715 RepID=A0AAN7NXN6_9COLE|nr:hypothetical protein RN001_016401 [Aquatica leii]